jgi:hypothetical protein
MKLPLLQLVTLLFLYLSPNLTTMPKRNDAKIGGGRNKIPMAYTLKEPHHEEPRYINWVEKEALLLERLFNSRFPKSIRFELEEIESIIKEGRQNLFNE